MSAIRNVLPSFVACCCFGFLTAAGCMPADTTIVDGSGGGVEPGSGGSAGGKSGSGGRMGSGGKSGSGGVGAGGAAGGIPGSGGKSGSGGMGSGGYGSGGKAGSGGMPGSGGKPGSGGVAGASGAGGAAGGTAVVSGLPVPPGSANVPKPSGSPGNLTVLNWAGFKGAVSYTFDDASASQIANYSKLQALGVRMTFYLWTNQAGASNAIWGQAIKDGHELGNHTASHQETATAGDIDSATSFLKTKWGVTAYTMAAPYGNPSYSSFAETRFLLNRGTSNGLIGPNDSSAPFATYCYIPPANAAASAFNAEVDSARTAGKWKIVLVHGFTGTNDGAYLPVSVTEFVAGVNHAKQLGDMWIDSMVNVGAYWRGQKTFTSVTPTTSGSSKVWTWTLPANFPPRKYLRVKVDGGTLTQNGQTLAWDPHGYYEVALDARTLTLSP